MKGYGAGSSLQMAAQAITAALQGLAGGNLNEALAGAAAPYLAGVIKDLTQGNPEANKFAHAVLGAVIAQLKGESALAGGVAAGTAPAIAKILQEKMYPGIQLEDLSEEQKQTISALTTLAGGLVGGLATGDASGALTGGQAAKNEVDNNSLNSRSGKNLMHTLRSCAGHCDVKQLEKDFKEQSAQWDKVVSSRCEGAGANLLTCGHTISGLQESMTFISSAYGMAKTAEEREVLGKLYNQQVADINRAIASLSKLDASASLVEQFIAVTLPALPDLIAGAGSSKPIGSGAKPGSSSKDMLGAGGTQTSSTTVWKGQGKTRIDVENPAPGERPGQVHYQDNSGNKYYYQPTTNTFTTKPEPTSVPAPKDVQNLLKDPRFANGIEKAIRYLGGR